jgi:hypothetical protein
VFLDMLRNVRSFHCFPSTLLRSVLETVLFLCSLRRLSRQYPEFTQNR